MKNFYVDFIEELLNNYNNYYNDNYDHYRFGENKVQQQKISNKAKNAVVKFVEKNLAKKNYGRVVSNNTNYILKIKSLEPYLNGLELLYNILCDDESKKLLLKLMAYRVLGFRKVKLPLSISAYWDGIREIENLADDTDSISVSFMNWKLSRINLNKKNIPVELYFLPVGAFISFILKEYEYQNGTISIKAEPGDYVIDAGGCWGDTALFFSNAVGDTGKVYSYEFIPGNLNLFRKNLSLNPLLEKAINIIERPVWETSGEPMFFIDNGPGSTVFFDENKKHDGKVLSLSIDDLVTENNISKIDFIKMDIEGAEPYALKGAINTIKKFKPKLAIAIYHSMNDFVNIPEFINSLDLGYKFYLGHSTIHLEETVLFAQCQTND